MLLGCVTLQASAMDPVSFESQVRPILKAMCLDCHGESDAPKAGLDLRLASSILKGGKSGPAVVAKQPVASLLLKRIVAGEMPPTKKKLTSQQIDVIREWIALGAKSERAVPETIVNGMVISTDDRAWWAFQPVRRPSVPQFDDPSVRTPVDSFILKKLKENQLTFAPEADRRTLIRRVTFDLIGLPPTPEEIAAFVGDPSPDAFDKLVDGLLASPQYGERWGRHWLDVAGYADSEGFSQDDSVRSNAWKYRDYVIRSFNGDKPFDQFVREQLAGDELVKLPYAQLPSAELDKLIATGFLRMAPDGTGSGGVDQKLARNQVVADTIKIVSSSLLGLTIACAQCHNHRYDPIPQTDYYRLRAVFEPGFNLPNWKPPAARQVSLYTDADRKKAQEIESDAAKIEKERLKKQTELIEATFQKELAKLPEAMREKAKLARNTPDTKRTPEQKRLMQEHPSLNVSAGSLYLYDQKAADSLKKLADDAASIRAKKPVEEFVRALTENPGATPPTHLFHRGDPDQPKQVVAPGGLTILDERMALAKIEPSAAGSGRRLAFANWLTSGTHPLTARVFVNRVWLHHFGRGIVGTPAEFGKLGEAPSHPELLDWLANEFVRSGWRVKQLHRLLVTSTAYRQSSRRETHNDAVDPDNRLFGRMNVRRLEAEAVRDAVLAVSGDLCDKPFGAPVPVRENDVGQIVVGKGTKDLARGSTKEEPLPPGEIARRSIYVQIRRSMPHGMLETFDAPVVEPNCEIRNASTAAPQALLMMNNEFVIQQSESLARRLLRECTTAESQVRRGWLLAWGIEPSSSQTAVAVAFLQNQQAYFRAYPVKGQLPDQQALALFCQALLSANRFLYVD